ncbi:MAG: hypothetical protein BMS9Abin32_551 [Gammaproteobacteria bacterium]|nr:MAG: hypothetical protein BMS9Abin32_551 [Gammaproteobacteria bacterium]
MQNFIYELRRRNVLRVATAYALVAWIIIEAGSVLLPTFGASTGAFQIYVIAVLAGFVVSIVFAWVFELTPEGVKLERHVDRTVPADRRSRELMNYAIIGLLIVALGVSITFNLSGVRDRNEPPPAAAAKKSIAVLPFSSRSSNPENVIFADGIHDDILTKLAKIAALKVISRTSVMKYRDTAKNVRQIGQELGVDNVLSGTVQRIGDSVRINVRLVDANTDANLWAESFDGELTMQSIFDLQSDISEAVSGALRATLSPAEQHRMTSIPTRDLRAYSLYVNARDNLYLRRHETLLEARTQFEQAIALDPDYAAARAGLAESILLLRINHNAIPFDEAIALAQAEIDRALELDPELADAYAIQGLLMQHVWEKNRQGNENVQAENAFRRALAINPNHASALMWFASLRDSEERLDEAIELYQRAMKLDPLGRIPYSNLPMIYAKQGRHDEALKLWANAIGIHPEWPTIYQYIAGHLMGMGRFDEAFAWNREANQLTTDPFIGGNIDIGVYYEFGDLEKAKALLREFPDDHPMSAAVQAFSLLIDGEAEASLASFVQLIADNQVPPKFFYGVASDTALIVGELELARKFILLDDPTLGGDTDLKIDRRTTANILRLAYIDKAMGNERRAYEMLTAMLPVVQSLPRLGTFGQGIREVEIYALLGRDEDALQALRAAVDAGFRSTLMQNNWPLEHDPYLQSIRTDARFTAMLREIRADIETMRINVEQAEADGNWDALLSRVEAI